MEVCWSVDSKEMNEMDRRQITTILYLIASLVLFLLAVLEENPLLGAFGLMFLVLGGFHSETQEEKGCPKP